MPAEEPHQGFPPASSAVETGIVAAKCPLSLPPELWLATMDHLRMEIEIPVTQLVRSPAPDIKVLKELTRVSRTLHTLAEPFIWERVRLSGSGVHAPKDGVRPILRLLDQNPDRKKWIKYLTLDRWDLTPRGDVEGSNKSDAEAVWSTFLELPNLIALSLHHVVAAPQLFAHLTALPALRAFSTFAFNVDTNSPESDDNPDPLSSLRSVILRGVRGNACAEEVVKAVIHPGLERLLHGTSFARYIHSQMTIHNFAQLREYHMVEPTLFDLTKLFQVAPSLPALTQLRIDTKVRNPSPHEQSQIHLAQDHLASLTCISAPLWLLAKLVPGRPIRDLEIQNLRITVTNHDHELFKLLAPGCAQVTSLTLEADAWVQLELGDIGEVFPALERLTLRNKGDGILPVRYLVVLSVPYD